MRQKDKPGVLWDLVSEDRDLVFFFLGFLIWVFDIVATVSGLGSPYWVSVAARTAVAALFLSGVVLYVRKHHRLASQLVSTKHLPVVFVVGKTQDERRDALALAQKAITQLTGFRAFRQIENVFNVRYDTLTPHERKRLAPDVNQWKNFIEDAERDIRRFSDAVAGDKVYHIFLDGPASLALGLGAAFGTKRPSVIYQFTDGQYYPVIDLRKDLRRVKQTISGEYHYLNASYPPSFTRDTAVVLDMASHPATGRVNEHLQRQGGNMAVVVASNTYAGNLTESDWVNPVRELYTVLRGLQGREAVSGIHLFHSMPVAMAFGLGMALGNFVPVTVYNWEASEARYYPVLHLNEVDSFL